MWACDSKQYARSFISLKFVIHDIFHKFILLLPYSNYVKILQYNTKSSQNLIVMKLCN